MKAQMGILIVAASITKGMADVAATAGSYTAPLTRTSYPKIQIISIADLLAHRKPRMPTAILPYVKAKPHADQLLLDTSAGSVVPLEEESPAIDDLDPEVAELDAPG
jgi:hypothetical protein